VTLHSFLLQLHEKLRTYKRELAKKDELINHLSVYVVFSFTFLFNNNLYKAFLSKKIGYIVGGNRVQDLCSLSSRINHQAFHSMNFRWHS